MLLGRVVAAKGEDHIRAMKVPKTKWLICAAIIAVWLSDFLFDLSVRNAEAQLAGGSLTLTPEIRGRIVYFCYWMAATIPIVLFTLWLHGRTLANPLKLAAHIGGLLLAYAGHDISWILINPLHPGKPPDFCPTAILQTSIMALYWSVWMYSVTVAITLGWEHYRSLLGARVRVSEYRSSLAQAQLQALKLQLQPHFLFNTLHSVSALIRDNPDAADDVLADLGTLLRLSLETQSTQEVPVEEELKALDLYLKIQRVRYQDWLTLHLTVAPEVRAALMPHLLLQPLVENAIRHGIARRAEPGTLFVDISRHNTFLRLSVRDDGPGCVQPGSIRNGVGLTNTRTRLDTLYGHDNRLDIQSSPDGFAIIIELPFRLFGSALPC